MCKNEQFIIVAGRIIISGHIGCEVIDRLV
ncbi:hypothetical protein DFN06_003161 [Clostridium beijerinckii]|nr:hypothetical protein [Clostridium beijerinckii]NYB96765.1 hypothetical protein [Clostridium beijerinckii]OOM22579.1 hypothetical protein CLBEI_31670 [Clostridium beijerinckii]SQB19925.1 Uncharacterised protein [Clostridium beijerinckii]